MRRILALAAALVCLLPATASASLGNTAVGTSDQPGAGSAGNAQDWKSTATATESINRLNVYLFSGSPKPDLAVYNSAKAKTASCTITAAVTQNGWYSCAITQSPAPTIQSGSIYYRAILSPKNAGIVNFGNHVGTGTPSFGMKQTSCPAPCNLLPNTWVDGTSYGSAGQNASMYADSSTPQIDATPPTASFTAPTSGQSLSGTINVAATATDNTGGSGVWFVAFRVDDPASAPVNVDYSSPYGFALDTTTLSDGPHTLYARPEDNAQNVGADATRTFTVNNAVPPDQDGDGVPDSSDQCPSTPGPASNSGCPLGVPGPIAGQGYHEVLRDDFNTLDRNTWDDNIWYDENPHADWTDFQTVENGILHLRARRAWGYPMNTVTTQSSGKTFKYGYFETRMKWTGGHGAWPGFWLYSYQHAIDAAQCTTQAGEIDAFEGQGSEPQSYYGTVHSNTNGCAPADNQNGNNWQPAGVDLTADFHTYAVKWVPGTVTWYLDGRALMSAPTYATDDQQMFLLLQMWEGGWTFDTDVTTPDLIETQVDYVDVWQP